MKYVRLPYLLIFLLAEISFGVYTSGREYCKNLRGAADFILKRTGRSRRTDSERMRVSTVSV